MSIRPLNPELAKKALEKFQEDPEKLQNALQEVRNWLALQPHIHARTDDQWLAAFIRGFKYDLEKVQRNLDLFYTCRHTASSLYQLHHKDAKFKELLNTGFYLPLPKLSGPAAPRVFLIRVGVFDVEKLAGVAFSVAHVIDKIMMVDDDNATIAENICIIDFKDTDLLSLLHLPVIQMRMLIAKLDAVPLYTLNIIAINVTEVFGFFGNLYKKIMDETDGGELFVYNENYEEMYTKYGVSKEIMPVEYGGTGGTLEDIIEHWKEKVEEYSEWLEEDLKFGTDESIRQGGPRTAEDMFGVQPMGFNILQIMQKKM